MKIRFLLAALALSAAPALAQTAPNAPTDTRVIGDFAVRCFPVKSVSPCDFFQEQDQKETNQRVLGFSIAFAPSANRYLVQIAVPLGVSIEKGLVVQASGLGEKPPVLRYRRCDRAGCYVEMAADRDWIDRLSRSGNAAKIHIVSDGGKGFDLNLSLNGFTAAHDAMVELARAKASSAPAAAAAPAAPAAPATP